MSKYVRYVRRIWFQLHPIDTKEAIVWLHHLNNDVELALLDLDLYGDFYIFDYLAANRNLKFRRGSLEVKSVKGFKSGFEHSC